MRELFDGNLSDNIRGVALADSTTAINILEHLQQCEHSAALMRNLLELHKELAKARASIGLAAVAAFVLLAALLAASADPT